jgi:hypothetical protein
MRRDEVGEVLGHGGGGGAIIVDLIYLVYKTESVCGALNRHFCQTAVSVYNSSVRMFFSRHDCPCGLKAVGAF